MKTFYSYCPGGYGPSTAHLADARRGMQDFGTSLDHSPGVEMVNQKGLLAHESSPMMVR
jgi:hypothetical protein